MRGARVKDHKAAYHGGVIVATVLHQPDCSVADELIL